MNNNLRMSEKSENITKAYINCCKSIRNVYKSAKNTHQNYKYATLEDVVDSIKEELSENNLAIISSISNDPKRLDHRVSKNGLINYNVEVKLTIRLMHESGEWIEIDCFGEGQDSGDKALYKAITGAKKYGIQNLFGMATTDDPERDDYNSRSTDNNKVNLNNSSKQKSNQLIDAFSSIGVSREDILNRYKITSIDNLNSNDFDELRNIFTEIKKGNSVNSDYFNK